MLPPSSSQKCKIVIKQRLSTHSIKTVFKLCLFGFALTQPLASLANSQGHKLSALEEEILWLKEETYVTTATKTLESVSKSGATVTVITEEELKNMGARTLMDALKRVPGLGVSQFNIGMPAVEVRGVKTDFGEKVLFLINGHPSNTNLVNGGGTWVYENFIVDEIKQVEIVRGTGSALYGADAFMATINIITKDAADIDGSRITLGAGSYKTKKLNLEVGHQSNDLAFAINANITDTDGFKGYIEHDALGRSGELDSWVQRYDLGFNLTYNHFSFQGKYVERHAGGYAGVANALNKVSEQDYTQYFLQVGYSRDLTNQLNFTTKLYFDHFYADNFWQFFPENPDFDDPDGMIGRTPGKIDRSGANTQIIYEFSKQNKLLMGAMFEHQSLYDVRYINNFNPFTGLPTGAYEDNSDLWNWNSRQSRDLYAIYAQDIWDLNRDLRFIIGARYDNYSDFGGTLNPRTSVTWEFINGYSLIATYGSAFRAPSFGELYNDNNPGIVGNPDVEPEEIETYELALHGQVSKRVNFKTTFFHNNIRNLIEPGPSERAASEPTNAGKLKVDGLELELNSRLHDGSTIALNYTYQYAINGNTDRRAANVPKEKLNASYTYRVSRYVNLYAGLNHRGEVKRSSGDTRSDIGSHTTLDIAATWSNAANNLDVTASIYNFFDKSYTDPSPDAIPVSDPERSDYPKPCRNIMLEVSYKL